MKLEGRICIGLDEFMLRLGHLKILIQVMPKVGGSRARVLRKFSEELIRPVPVTYDQIHVVAKYLAEKRLVAVVSDGKEVRQPHAKSRYPTLVVTTSDDEDALDISDSRGGPVSIWFQDWALAQPQTPSKLGAVTIEAKEITNKSGVSHLFDWAVILGIANRRLALSAEGRVLASLLEALNSRKPNTNPYVIGAERAFFAWLVFREDGDVLRSLLEAIVESGELTKKSAVDAMADIARSFSGQAKIDPWISARTVQRIREFHNDLGLKSHGRELGSPSTVWHRASSRLEVLVDLGLITKRDPKGASREFDYYYSASSLTEEVLESINARETWEEWLEEDLCTLVGKSLGTTKLGFEPETLRDAVLTSLGPTGLHISSFAAAAVTLGLAKGYSATIREAREFITALAQKRPEIARVSRGYSGNRAEFASVTVGELDTSIIQSITINKP